MSSCIKQISIDILGRIDRGVNPPRPSLISPKPVLFYKNDLLQGVSGKTHENNFIEDIQWHTKFIGWHSRKSLKAAPCATTKTAFIRCCNVTEKRYGGYSSALPAMKFSI
jgi:hypothetical protein